MSEHAASETSKVSPLHISTTSLNTDGMFDRFKDSLGLSKDCTELTVRTKHVISVAISTSAENLLT